jgi:hypothetical protein
VKSVVMIFIFESICPITIIIQENGEELT